LAPGGKARWPSKTGLLTRCARPLEGDAQQIVGHERLYTFGMKRRFLIIVLVLLTAFVLQTAARIEVLNVRAGNYLPRSDRDPDGTLTDGTWRISQENAARDQLRAAVQTFGLLQYVLAPLLLIFSLAVFFKTRGSWASVAATFSVFAAAAAISLMLYREYFQSLGW